VLFQNLPLDIQKRYGYDSQNDPHAHDGKPTETLDQKCARFLRTQIDQPQPVNNNQQLSITHNPDGSEFKIVRVVTTAPVDEPLFLNGKQVGKETLDPGTVLNISSDQGSELFLYEKDPNLTFGVPATATNWGDRFTMLDAIREMDGFIDRVNQILEPSATQISYDPSSTKRFKIADTAGHYWAFNPEDLSSTPSSICDQSESSDQDTYLSYTHIRAIGYSDDDSTVVAAEGEHAGVISHTQTTKTVYFVTVASKQDGELFDTNEPGDVQKKRLIFRLSDRADAKELADLFSHFRNTFSGNGNK
jgi:hypothetical protein